MLKQPVEALTPARQPGQASMSGQSPTPDVGQPVATMALADAPAAATTTPGSPTSMAATEVIFVQQEEGQTEAWELRGFQGRFVPIPQVARASGCRASARSCYGIRRFRCTPQDGGRARELPAAGIARKKSNAVARARDCLKCLIVSSSSITL